MPIFVGVTEVFDSAGEIAAAQVASIPTTYGPTGPDGLQGNTGAQGSTGAQGPQGNLLYGANCSNQGNCQYINCLSYVQITNCYYYNCYDCNYSA
ncbi:hypothetical protein N9112_00025 [bacterium]|nr:hypothetical protein [bacterium]